jgi:hypothetical protein
MSRLSARFSQPIWPLSGESRLAVCAGLCNHHKVRRYCGSNTPRAALKYSPGSSVISSSSTISSTSGGGRGRSVCAGVPRHSVSPSPRLSIYRKCIPADEIRQIRYIIFAEAARQILAQWGGRITGEFTGTPTYWRQFPGVGQI